MDCSPSAPLSMGFSKQEYWSGLPFHFLGDLPDPGIKSVSPVTPSLQVDSLPMSHWGSPSISTSSKKYQPVSWEAKGKGEKERYIHLNAEFQRIPRRDKKDLSEQCKEIEENNRM